MANVPKFLQPTTEFKPVGDGRVASQDTGHHARRNLSAPDAFLAFRNGVETNAPAAVS